MHSDVPNDLFLLWLSTIRKDDTERGSWQQAFSRGLKRDFGLSQDWKSLITAGCNPDVLNALLWEISTPAGLKIIDDRRDWIKAAKTKQAATDKALSALNISMRRTAAEIAKNLGLLNLLYEGLLQHRKRLLSDVPDANAVKSAFQTVAPIGETSELPSDCTALGDPAFLAIQLSAWAESLSGLLSVTRSSNQKITDARRFLPILKYVSQFCSVLPYAPLARLI